MANRRSSALCDLLAPILSGMPSEQSIPRNAQSILTSSCDKPLVDWRPKTRMTLFHGLENLVDCRQGWVAIGNFDGVHRGHRQMIGTLVDRARQQDAPAIVLTFEPHPITILRPEFTPPRLTTIERKADLLSQLGVDAVIAFPTDAAFLELSPAEFFQRFLEDALDARGLVEGPNFQFGKDRAGTVQTLAALCAATNRELQIVEPTLTDGVMISSSLIRGALENDDFATAVALLGHPHEIRGRVVHGAARGRSLGFPTANLAEVPVLLPADGVYAGSCTVDGQTFAAAVHIGPNPTFGENPRKVEVHLIGFAGQLYGRELVVELTTHLRSLETFASVELLQQQLQCDIAAAGVAINGTSG